ncbi:tryptophan synthase beta subunit-like PLP-dependent enzyme [Dimargaris cristalligena]|uniref:Tryptophan synthase beta subunit-like PLP-dependent enzyme n=1 Tax=Dimargaris cristalligena TaxID=215637 RepID=A0A4P9ZQP3_9FUNG|nr:tryptophan synthase beta subunit-like PLP-dependent enzyme [Dimargaris cristalligena]|eukprot:RKP35635.1 tryptophan synthase beta subunit-like PLP-dependent enzyme [Dimargaris cristalligena]
MAQSFPTLADIVGRTPVVQLAVANDLGVHPNIELLAKLEYLNPFGSLSDRVAQKLLPTLPPPTVTTPPPRSGTAATTLVIPSSGNLAISMAALAVPKGYRVTAVIPERTSKDRIMLLKALDVEIVRAPDNVLPEAPESFTSLARQITAEMPGAVLVDLFAGSNDVENLYHELATEILEQCHGHLDVLVVGVESGSSITGLAKHLKRKLPALRVVGVEPTHSAGHSQPITTTSRSALISQNWKLEDLGQHAIPAALDPECVDLWCQVTDQVAYSMARRLIRSGFLAGVSSGAVVAATHTFARTSMQPGERALVLLNDTARNYGSTLLSNEWLLNHELMDDGLARKLHYQLINKYRGASVEDLQLPAAVAIAPTDPLGQALDIMVEREYSQLPVVSAPHRKLVGYITLATLQSMLENQKVELHQPVKDAIPLMRRPSIRPRYELITPSTPLNELAEFFEHHSVAFVTDSSRKFCLGVVTKFDLMKFISRRHGTAPDF